MKNNKLMLPLIAATLLLSIGYSQGCKGTVKGEKYISPESEVRLLVEGQTIKVVGKDNQEADWLVGKDYYVIHGERLREILEKVHRLTESSYVPEQPEQGEPPVK